MTSVAEIDQWICTACKVGRTGTSGIQTYSLSASVTPEEDAELFRITEYRVPDELRDRPSEARQPPVVLGYRYLTSHRPAVFRSMASPTDHLGRTGNYLAHALLCHEHAAGRFAPFDLWGSSLFRAPLSMEEMTRRPPDFLPALGEEDLLRGCPALSVADSGRVRTLVELGALYQKFDEFVMDRATFPLVILGDELDVLDAVAALERITERRLRFVTYLPATDYSVTVSTRDYDIVGAPPGVDLNARWRDEATHLFRWSSATEPISEYRDIASMTALGDAAPKIATATFRPFEAILSKRHVVWWITASKAEGPLAWPRDIDELIDYTGRRSEEPFVGLVRAVLARRASDFAQTLTEQQMSRLVEHVACFEPADSEAVSSDLARRFVRHSLEAGAKVRDAALLERLSCMDILDLCHLESPAIAEADEKVLVARAATAVRFLDRSVRQPETERVFEAVRQCWSWSLDSPDIAREILFANRESRTITRLLQESVQDPKQARKITSLLLASLRCRRRGTALRSPFDDELATLLMHVLRVTCRETEIDPADLDSCFRFYGCKNRSASAAALELCNAVLTSTANRTYEHLKSIGTWASFFLRNGSVDIRETSLQRKFPLQAFLSSLDEQFERIDLRDDREWLHTILHRGFEQSAVPAPRLEAVHWLLARPVPLRSDGFVEQAIAQFSRLVHCSEPFVEDFLCVLIDDSVREIIARGDIGNLIAALRYWQGKPFYERIVLKLEFGLTAFQRQQYRRAIRQLRSPT